jgi:DNA-binding response OmpR family regulator
VLARVLVVEDEAKVAQALHRGLTAEQYAVTVASTGEDAFFLASSIAFDAVNLDVML